MPCIECMFCVSRFCVSTSMLCVYTSRGDYCTHSRRLMQAEQSSIDIDFVSISTVRLWVGLCLFLCQKVAVWHTLNLTSDLNKFKPIQPFCGALSGNIYMLERKHACAGAGAHLFFMVILFETYARVRGETCLFT